MEKTIDIDLFVQKIFSELSHHEINSELDNSCNAIYSNKSELNFANYLRTLKYKSMHLIIYKKCHIISVVYDFSSNCVSLCYTSYDHFVNFMQKIVKETLFEQKNSDIHANQIKIFDTSCGSEYTMRPTLFKNIISKQKNEIMKTLDIVRHNCENEDDEYFPHKMYNLGILLYGKPGTGKTTFTKAIATYLNYNIELIDVSKVKTAKELKKILCGNFYDSAMNVNGQTFKINNIVKNEKKKEKKIIVMDEFDILLENLKIKEVSSRDIEIMTLKTDMAKSAISFDKDIECLTDKLTLDNLLTCLDGIVQAEGRIIVATTNNLEKIEKRLIRPGRFDLVIELDYFDRDELYEFLNFHFDKDKIPKNIKYDIRVPPCFLTNLIARNKTLDEIVYELENNTLEQMEIKYDYVL